MIGFRIGMLVLILFAQGVPIVFAEENSFQPDLIITDNQMTDTSAITAEQVHELLSRGSLASYKTFDTFGQKKSAEDIILEASARFELNPQVLLVLLQKEQSIVEDPSPTQDQLDWAMGYAICDDCSKQDEGIQKYKGFGNQVHFAAKRLRESYLNDLARIGKTISGVGPGIIAWIDGISIIPANYATASLYTYTPHFRGNKNFFTIWQRWFSREYPNGSLLRDRETQQVWFIQKQLKRRIYSSAALASRFQPDRVIDVASDLLKNYPEGSMIRFPNYSLLRSKKGTVYLTVDDLRRGFSSMEAFRASGFLQEEIVDVTDEELQAYQEGEPITTSTTYAHGTLLQNNKTGGVYFVEQGKKSPLLSREILTAQFGKHPILAVDPEQLEVYQTIRPIGFPDGTLIGVKGYSEVFVIEDGLRRPIEDAGTFLQYGWNWNQIRFTNEKSVLIHPLGKMLSTKLQQEKIL